MKKTYSTPLVTASDVVRETLGSPFTTVKTQEGIKTTINMGIGFGL